MNKNIVPERFVLIEVGGSAKFSLFTESNLKVATGYNGVVFGCRGTYIEFDDTQILKNKLKIPQDSGWRFYNDACCYIEYRTKDKSFVKVYFQLKEVNYADYKKGFYYISILDLKDSCSNSLIKKEGT